MQGEPYDTSNGGWPHADTEDRLWEEPHGWILDGQPFQVSFHQQSAVTGLPYDLPFYHTTASNPTMQPDPSFYSPQECPSPQDQISDTTVYQGIPPFQPPISDTYSQVGYNSQLQPYPTTSYTQLPSYNYQGASGGLGLQQPNVQSYLSTPMQFVPQFHGMPSESKSHQVTATSNKPYYCCGRDYGSKHRLRQHMSTDACRILKHGRAFDVLPCHCDAKPDSHFKCLSCGKYCAIKKSVKRHMGCQKHV